MYVITDNAGVIIHISETIGYQENGNALVDNGTLAIASILVSAVSNDVEIPAGVAAQTHTYIDGTFATNPNYVAPEIPIEQRNRADIDYLLMLAEEV